MFLLLHDIIANAYNDVNVFLHLNICCLFVFYNKLCTQKEKNFKGNKRVDYDFCLFYPTNLFFFYFPEHFLQYAAYFNLVYDPIRNSNSNIEANEVLSNLDTLPDYWLNQDR